MFAEAFQPQARLTRATGTDIAYGCGEFVHVPALLFFFRRRCLAYLAQNVLTYVIVPRSQGSQALKGITQAHEIGMQCPKRVAVKTRRDALEFGCPLLPEIPRMTPKLA